MLPLFAAIYVIKNKDDVIFAMRVLCFCALFNTALGILEFRLSDASWLTSSRPSMLNALIQNNPALEALLEVKNISEMVYFRASSTFMTPLAFGEFEMIVIPIGLFFALQREKLTGKVPRLDGCIRRDSRNFRFRLTGRLSRFFLIDGRVLGRLANSPGADE